MKNEIIVLVVFLWAVFLVASYKAMKPEQEMQIWAVKCTNGEIEYQSPRRLDLQFEVNLCKMLDPPPDDI